MNDEIIIESKTRKVTTVDDTLYSIARDVSQGLANLQYIYCIEEGIFYIYTDGYWKITHEIELLDEISKNIRITHFPIQRRRQILDNMKYIKYERLSNFNKFNAVNLNNYMIEPVTGSVIKHDPKYLSTIRLNYDYQDRAQCNLWIKVLNDIFEGDQDRIDVLQEFFGYCLTRDVSREKSLLLLGESRSGKSTILETVSNMLGVDNTASVALGNLSNAQYTPLLINKMVNIDWDVASGAESYEANFKIITSGEPISVNQKFIAAFTFRPYCKLLMAANKFPRITDHSSAFYKRLILLPCDRVFEPHEQDLQLKNKLKEEMPGILNWSIRGLHRLEKRGSFEVSKKFMIDAIEELREESNPVDIFFRENVLVDVSGGYEIEKKDLYERYIIWCKLNGNAPMANNKFGSLVFTKYSKYTPKRTTSAITGNRVWKNMKWINNPIPKGERIDYTS